MLPLQLLGSISTALFGTLLTLAPHAAALPLDQQNDLLAQNGSRGCRSGESTFVATETDNYWIYICGGDYPGNYVGIEKRNPSRSIRLPLSDYDSQGNFFEAANGDVIYILARTSRGVFLTVTQGSEELLREPVLSSW